MNQLGKKRKPKPVTLIVGIIYGDEIVLAGDSQTTWGTSKRTDTLKIDSVTFQDQSSILLGQAGDATMAGRCIEIITKTAAECALDDYRKPAELAEEAIRSVKQQIIHLNDWENNLEFSRQYFEDNTFGFLIGYRYKEKAYLYEIDSAIGVANRKYNYACLGCGTTVAEFILSRSVRPNMKYHQAMITAIYAIEEVKKVDAFCGGPTKLGMVLKDGIRGIYDNQQAENLINPVVEAINKHDRILKAQWQLSLDKIIGEAIEEIDKRKANAPKLKEE